jgi:hypothetical protein
MAMLSGKTRACFAAGLFLAAFLALPGSAIGRTRWVSPSGTAGWSACTGDIPLSGVAACSLALANTSAAPGDTVWLRGGTYSIDVDGGAGVNPSQSGTGTARIVFTAYQNEPVTLTQASTAKRAYGILLNGKSWIKVTGITFKNFQLNAVAMNNGASYNEISHCSFYTESGFEPGDRVIVIGGYTAPWSVHNWFHHNYVSRKHSATSPCNEAVDLVRLGNAQVSPLSADNNNTFEYNYLEYGGHATLVTYSKYNVVRNNIAHNEPWIAGCTSYDGSIGDLTGAIRGSRSPTSLTLGIGTQTLMISAGLGSTWASSQPVSIIYAAAWSKAESGHISSYNATTGELVVNVSKVASGATGTYSEWIVSQRNMPSYANKSYTGLYGHRVFCIGDQDLANPNFNLIEGNRLGFAGVNPNNLGANNLDLESPRNIVRYNFAYGAFANGIAFKSAVGDAGNPPLTGGVMNYVYSNTSYGNGKGYDPSIYSGTNSAWSGQGVGQYASYGTGNTRNVVKNNLVYGNGSGDICKVSWGKPACTPDPMDIVINNLTGRDPSFVNPDLADPTSQDLFSSVHGYASTALPDLRLNAGSAAIDGAGYLTQARGSGSNVTTLSVDDAGYFQDATWGSSLSSVRADWIAIDRVDNTVQILSINRSTNTITLSRPMTWNDRAGIWLYRKSDGALVLVGAGPDFGASEFGAGVPPQPPNSAVILR